MRKYLLELAKDGDNSKLCGKEEDSTRQEIEQLKITIDTIVRAQIFETKEILFQAKCVHVRSIRDEQPDGIGCTSLASPHAYDDGYVI
jgi:hypothetical protein